MHDSAIDPTTVCAVVLAAGRATRMGGVDKGLQNFQGQALALHAVQRLRAQTAGPPGCIAINANRNLPNYAAWGLPVWPDLHPDYAGPLAGFASALHHCRNAPERFPYLLTVPCDAPRFPLDLLARLTLALLREGACIAVASSPEPDPKGAPVMRMQPVFCLMKTSLEPHLRNYLNEGGRKVGAWIAQHLAVRVPFDAPADDPLAFYNANTLEQLQHIERQSTSAHVTCTTTLDPRLSCAQRKL